MIPACDGRSDRRSDGRTESIIAKTALCIASYADALSKNDITSLDFAVNQFFMKLFFTSDINIVSECQLTFNFRLPSEQLAQRKDRFISRLHCV